MSPLTIVENQSLAAGARRVVTAEGNRDLVVAEGSAGQWIRKKQFVNNYGNLQAGAFITVAVFELAQPCEAASLVVDVGSAIDAGAIHVG
jgi:hypothetical protein